MPVIDIETKEMLKRWREALSISETTDPVYTRRFTNYSDEPIEVVTADENYICINPHDYVDMTSEDAEAALSAFDKIAG